MVTSNRQVNFITIRNYTGTVRSSLKHFVECLVPKKCSINVSYCFISIINTMDIMVIKYSNHTWVEFIICFAIYYHPK